MKNQTEILENLAKIQALGANAHNEVDMAVTLMYCGYLAHQAAKMLRESQQTPVNPTDTVKISDRAIKLYKQMSYKEIPANPVKISDTHQKHSLQISLE